MKNSLQYAKEVFVLLGESRIKLPGMTFLFLLSGLLDVAGLGLIVPYVTLIIDPAVAEIGVFSTISQVIDLSLNTNELIMFLGMMLLVLYLAKAFAAYFINRTILRFSWEQQVRLRTWLMGAYQQLPYNIYLRRNSSEYIQTISGLTGQFSQGIVMTGLKLVSDGIVGLSILVVLAWVNWVALGLFLVLVGGTVLGYDRLFRRKLKGYGERVTTAGERVMKAVQEGIRGFKEIRVLGVERLFLTMVERNSKDLAEATTSRDLIVALPRFLIDFMLFLFVVSIVAASILLGFERQELIPTLSLFGVGALRLVPIANSVSQSLVLFRFNRYATSRLYTDVQEIQEAATVVQQKSDHGGQESFRMLEVRNITFRYEGVDQPTLRNLSFEISKGDSIGIMGPSGSGKTTFIDVILGMLEPQKGEIFVNNKPLKVEVSNWRSQVAYLPQDGFIIDDTLYRNVTLGTDKNEVDEERLNQALDQSQLLQLLNELPNGVETLLGENGIRLSGGQRQRVSIARALYRGRQVLIMDEATSALDDETEKEIVDEIKRLKGSATTLVIAHRLSTLRHCNRVYRLEKGQLVKIDIR